MTTRVMKKKPLSVERILSITGVIISLVALYFSWEANRIAEQQIKAKVIAVSSSYAGASEREFSITNGLGHDFTCTHKLRLSNLGGASASLIRWTATLFYKGESVRLSGEQPYSLDSKDMNDYIKSFLVDFVQPETRSGQNNEQTFPIQVPAYSTVEVYIRARFSVWRDVSFFYPPYDYYAFLEPGQDYTGLSPVEISVSFITSTGQEVAESPRALCLYMQPR
ncbi:MAG: hypothetical protein QXU75_06055 [Candidatus Methanomethylicaceae archaeon]